MTTTTATFRTFTREESSAVRNLHIEQEGYVEVIFHSNTEKAYGFNSNPEYCAKLIDAISWSDLPYSIGKMIAEGRKNGDLIAIAD